MKFKQSVWTRYERLTVINGYLDEVEVVDGDFEVVVVVVDEVAGPVVVVDVELVDVVDDEDDEAEDEGWCIWYTVSRKNEIWSQIDLKWQFFAGKGGLKVSQALGFGTGYSMRKQNVCLFCFSFRHMASSFSGSRPDTCTHIWSTLIQYFKYFKLFKSVSMRKTDFLIARHVVLWDFRSVVKYKSRFSRYSHISTFLMHRNDVYDSPLSHA